MFRTRRRRLAGWHQLAFIAAIVAVLVVSLILQSVGLADAAWVALFAVVVLVLVVGI